MARRLQIAVSMADSDLAEAVHALLAMRRRYKVTDLDLDGVAGADGEGVAGALAHADVVVLDADQLSRLESDDPDRFAELHARAKIVLVLRIDDDTDVTESFRKCHGVVFENANLDRLVEVIEFALRGYFVVPGALMPEVGPAQDRLRRALLAKLSEPERKVFELLGRGCSNEAISRELGTSVANVKNLVRKLLKGLRFHNRTKAAVFAVRERAGVRSLREDRNGGAATTYFGPIATDTDSTIEGAPPMSRWRKTLSDDSGMSRIEYAIFAVVIAVWAAIGAESLDIWGSGRAADRCGAGECTVIVQSFKRTAAAHARTQPVDTAPARESAPYAADEKAKGRASP